MRRHTTCSSKQQHKHLHQKKREVIFCFAYCTSCILLYIWPRSSSQLPYYPRDSQRPARSAPREEHRESKCSYICSRTGRHSHSAITVDGRQMLQCVCLNAFSASKQLRQSLNLFQVILWIWVSILMIFLISHRSGFTLAQATPSDVTQWIYPFPPLSWSNRFSSLKLVDGNLSFTKLVFYLADICNIFPHSCLNKHKP